MVPALALVRLCVHSAAWPQHDRARGREQGAPRRHAGSAAGDAPGARGRAARRRRAARLQRPGVQPQRGRAGDPRQLRLARARQPAAAGAPRPHASPAPAPSRLRTRRPCPSRSVSRASYCGVQTRAAPESVVPSPALCAPVVTNLAAPGHPLRAPAAQRAHPARRPSLEALGKGRGGPEDAEARAPRRAGGGAGGAPAAAGHCSCCHSEYRPRAQAVEQTVLRLRQGTAQGIAQGIAPAPRRWRCWSTRTGGLPRTPPGPPGRPRRPPRRAARRAPARRRPPPAR
jgi:hypothetical protein